MNLKTDIINILVYVTAGLVNNSLKKDISEFQRTEYLFKKYISQEKKYLDLIKNKNTSNLYVGYKIAALQNYKITKKNKKIIFGYFIAVSLLNLNLNIPRKSSWKGFHLVKSKYEIILCLSKVLGLKIEKKLIELNFRQSDIKGKVDWYCLKEFNYFIKSSYTSKEIVCLYLTLKKLIPEEFSDRVNNFAPSLISNNWSIKNIFLIFLNPFKKAKPNLY
jgi:hypothetical protein